MRVVQHKRFVQRFNRTPQQLPVASRLRFTEPAFGDVDANFHEADQRASGITLGLKVNVGPVLVALFGPVQDLNPATAALRDGVGQGLQGEGVGLATAKQLARRFAQGLDRAVTRHARKTFVDPGDAPLGVGD